MRTLKDEQLEDILAGDSHLPDNATPDDLGRYEDLKAVKARMVSAFNSVPIPDGFAQRLSNALASKQATARRKIFTLPFRLAACGSIAAGIVATVILLWNPLPTTVHAGPTSQDALYKIHQQNLGHQDGFINASDRNHLKAGLQNDFGFSIHLPDSAYIASFCGCASRDFLSESVASYMVKFPNDIGRASIVLVEKPVSDLGFGQVYKKSGRTFAICHKAKCMMVAVRIGDLTYIALSSKVPVNKLTELLENIITTSEK